MTIIATLKIRQRASLWLLLRRTSSATAVSSIIVVTTLLLFVTSISTTNASVLRGNNDSRPIIPSASSSRKGTRNNIKSRKLLKNEKNENVVGTKKDVKRSKKSKHDDHDQHDAKDEKPFVSKLFDAYEESVELGIIGRQSKPTQQPENNGGSSIGNDVMEPIAAMLTETITAVMSQMGTGIGGKEENEDGRHYRSGGGMHIKIENEISGNTFTENDINGLNFSPHIIVQYDSHGSLHGNNNAHSDSGDVIRQNGQVDFSGALQDNNNAYSTFGDVLRQNGIISGSGSGSGNDDASSGGVGDIATAAAATTDNNGQTNGLATTTTTISDEQNKNDNTIITIHNRIVNNKFITNKQNGLIITPIIEVDYNQSDSLYNNNGATSGSGNVQRQNGGVDFSDALKGNNNAYSVLGDVIRQNGLIVVGDITIELAQEILDLLINDLLVGLKSLLPTKLIDELFKNIINIFDSLIKKLLSLGSTTIIDVDSTASKLLLDLNNEMTMIMVVDDIESDISSKEATIVLSSLLEFLDEFNTVINDPMKSIFEPLILFLQRISEGSEEEEMEKLESPEENEPSQRGRVVNTNVNSNNDNKNNGRRLGIDSSSSRRRKLERGYYDDDDSSGSAKKCSEKTNTNDNFVDTFFTESILSMLSFNTLQQTIVDSVGDFSSNILDVDKFF